MKMLENVFYATVKHKLLRFILLVVLAHVITILITLTYNGNDGIKERNEKQYYRAV